VSIIFIFGLLFLILVALICFFSRIKYFSRRTINEKILFVAILSWLYPTIIFSYNNFEDFLLAKKHLSFNMEERRISTICRDGGYYNFCKIDGFSNYLQKIVPKNSKVRIISYPGLSVPYAYLCYILYPAFHLTNNQQLADYLVLFYSKDVYNHENIITDFPPHYRDGYKVYGSFKGIFILKRE